VRVGEVSSFLPTGARLADGSTLPCDLVIFGTGFKKQYDVLPEEVSRTAVHLQVSMCARHDVLTYV
jgi:NAD(P)H-nitrite reductase large subunit